jgi:mannose-1-phosphate guanylyltransferase/mannose-6-phosphate isomerase
MDIGPNESTYIPIETRHRLENRGTEPLVVIEVSCGAYLGEDDIVRLDDQYGRVPG